MENNETNEVRRDPAMSTQKKFRKEIWTPFVSAVKEYELIKEGDKSRSACRAERTPPCSAY